MKEFKPEEFFRITDLMDAKAFAEQFSDSATFTMANYPSSQGKAAIAATADSVFNLLASIQHQIHKTWHMDNTCLLEGRVFYIRKDGQTFNFPFFSVFETSQGNVVNYRAYVDSSLLFS
jgi:ketosteroid isomerase-like protein